ncbi:MAG: NAD-dependent epimerase/dehydratase family protein [Anaerolineales bacterium]|nr:NAD-dependent epimerase/dehydratase family protein [Anaerolineales bacterium]
MDWQAAYHHKRALITGGLGFIGSNLARKLLALGVEVTIVDNLDSDGGGNPFNLAGVERDVRVIRAELADETQMKPLLHGQDYLFNLAGQMSHLGSMQNPLKDLHVNATSQLQVLELCRVQNPEIKIVFAGTRQVYGRPQTLPVDEQHALKPVDNNGVSKRAGEMYHLVYHRAYGMKTSVIRMTNVYGPRMRIKDASLNFMAWWFRQLLAGAPIQIFGTGAQVRDFTYVDDVVSALLSCAAAPEAYGKIYNLGGERSNLLNLARRMIELNGAGAYELVPFPEGRKRIDIGDYYADYKLIQRELGWEPQVSLAAGIRQTLEYYRAHQKEYLSDA